MVNRVNVGEAILRRLKELGINQSEFGTMMGATKQSASALVHRTSVDTDALVKYSELLEFNFFTLFCADELKATNANEDKVTMLERALAEEKARSDRYWSMIERLSGDLVVGNTRGQRSKI